MIFLWGLWYVHNLVGRLWFSWGSCDILVGMIPFVLRGLWGDYDFLIPGDYDILVGIVSFVLRGLWYVHILLGGDYFYYFLEGIMIFLWGWFLLFWGDCEAIMICFEGIMICSYTFGGRLFSLFLRGYDIVLGVVSLFLRGLWYVHILLGGDYFLCSWGDMI